MLEAMEELADAIEDAQYVNAISSQEDGPKPVIPWEKPSDDELVQWEQRVKSQSSSKVVPFSLEWCCQQPIGYFLFSQFLKKNHKDYARINFCEDVLRFRKLQTKQERLDLAVQMSRFFLGFEKSPTIVSTQASLMENNTQSNSIEALPEKRLELDRDNPTEDSLSSPSGRYIWPMPPRTEIEEYDLARPIHGCRSEEAMIGPKQVESFVSKLSAEELSEMFASSMDHPICSESIIGLKGPILTEILSIIKANATAVSPPKASRAASERSFHKADSVLQRRSSSDSLSFHFIDSRNPASSHSLSDVVLTNHETASNNQNVAVNGVVDNHRLNFSSRQVTQDIVSLPTDFFDTAECMVMESLRHQYWSRFVDSPYWIKLKHFLWYQDRRVIPDDFFVLRVLGRGGFGLVTACKKGTSGKLYAMKVMNKRRIKMKRSEALALNERKALAAVESKFVINLKYSFHSNEDVYFILDLMTGGDLGFHLHQRVRFPKRECLYYAARIMLGLQAMHDQGYVFRDLKPENCLLAEDGRVKITDLGLATKITPNLCGAAGTRGYWAPEMLQRDSNGKRKSYDHVVDWFSFGCCVAEFISGSNPFRSEAAIAFGTERGKPTKEKMIDCATLEMNPDFPPERFESDAADLCRRLLDKDPITRLGKNGYGEIMAHPWFKSLNWESIISDRKKPPFVPSRDVNAASQSQIGNFAEDTVYHETLLNPSDEEMYKDWDWTNPRAFAAEVIEFWIYERVTGEPLLPVAHNTGCCCTII